MILVLTNIVVYVCVCTYVESGDNSGQWVLSHHMCPEARAQMTRPAGPFTCLISSRVDTCDSAADAKECTGSVDLFIFY